MKSEEYYIRIPIKMLQDNRLSRSAIAVYGVLLDEVKPPLNMTDRLSIAAIAQRAGIHSATVRRAERQLVEAGYIRIDRTGRESMIWVLSDDIRIKEYSAYGAYSKAKRKEEKGA